MLNTQLTTEKLKCFIKDARCLIVDVTSVTCRLLVMRMYNLHGTEKEKEGEESSDEESDEEDEDEEKKPKMELAMMPHYGGVNRVRVCLLGNK